MTNIIKNQILKHLTKFTKNLSPEKIKINAFKGEGDVSNLEFDEDKLTELLELPNWIKIKRAACNKVAIKVQWTMIKKQPIILLLDEILLVVEALQIPRQPKAFTNAVPSYRSNTGSYGFSDRVIDGISVKINTVKIIFSSQMFKANIELMRVVVSSKMPNWADADHLKKTRVKSSSTANISSHGQSNNYTAAHNHQHPYNSSHGNNTNQNNQGNGGGAVLLFKEIEWDSTRIEANALGNIQATPVKLITNTIKIRTIIKKSLANCSILDSKVEFILNDLFWVLTISQIKAAILFSESLMGLIRLSNEMNKEAAKQRLENSARQLTTQTNQTTTSNHSSNVSGSYWTNASNIQQHQQSQPMTYRQKLFNKYDLHETSYHVVVQRIEFHFCEEGEQGVGMSLNAVINGSIKLLFINAQLDLYPYHMSCMTRGHFVNYKDISGPREQWIQHILSSNSSSSVNKHTADPYRQLMESITIVRFHDIRMNTVATASSNSTNKKQKARSSQPLIGSDIQKHRLPNKTCTFILDMTNHYWTNNSGSNNTGCNNNQLNSRSTNSGSQVNNYSGNNRGNVTNQLDARKLDLPETTIFCQLNPIFFQLDWETIIWLNAFFLNLNKELINLCNRLSEKEVNFDELVKNRKPKKPTKNPTAIHIETIMTRIILTPNNDLYTPNWILKPLPNPLLRPNLIQILIGALSVDNTLIKNSNEGSGFVDMVREHELKYTSWNKKGKRKFPFSDDVAGGNNETDDSSAINKDNVSDDNCANSIDFNGFYQELLHNRKNTKRIWAIKMHPIWFEFEGVPGYLYGCPNSYPLNSSGSQKTSTMNNTFNTIRPFIEPVNLNLLLMLPQQPNSLATNHHADYNSKRNSSSTHNGNGDDKMLLCSFFSTDQNQFSSNQGNSLDFNGMNSKALNLTLDHYQLMVLYRILDTVSDGIGRLSADKLDLDSKTKKDTKSQSLSGNVPSDNLVQDRTVVLLNIPDVLLSLKWYQPIKPNDSSNINDNQAFMPSNSSDGDLNSTNGSKSGYKSSSIHNNDDPAFYVTANHEIQRCLTPQQYLQSPHGAQTSRIQSPRQSGMHQIHSAANIPSNRRSCTSLNTMELDQVGMDGGGGGNALMLPSNHPHGSTSTQLHHQPQQQQAGQFNNLSNLMQCQSVKNLHGSTKTLQSTNRFSFVRKNSQLSINSTTDLSKLGSEYGDDDGDEDDWIISQNLLIDESEIDIDYLNQVYTPIQNFASLSPPALAGLPQKTECFSLGLADIRVVVDTCSMGTAVAVGIFRDLKLYESSRHESSSNSKNAEATDTSTTDNFIRLNQEPPSSSSARDTSATDNRHHVDTDEERDPIICMRIGAVTQPDPVNNEPIPVDIDIRVMSSLSIPLQMSSIVELADLLEDEVGFSVKYPMTTSNNAQTGSPTTTNDLTENHTNILSETCQPPSPRIKIELTCSVQLKLTEDRACTNQNTTCPGEHVSTQIIVPPGFFITMDGISLFTIKLGYQPLSIPVSFISPNSNQPPHSRRAGRNSSRSVGSNSSTGTMVNETHSHNIPDFNPINNNHSLESANPQSFSASSLEKVAPPLLPRQRSDDADSISSQRYARKLKEMNKLYKRSQEEIQSLRAQLYKVTQENNALINLGNSPQTNLL